MSKKHDINEFKKLAIQRGGECLSSEYINNKTNLEWKCSKGHIWYCRPDHILNGRWCRQCTMDEDIGNLFKMIQSRYRMCSIVNAVKDSDEIEVSCSEGHT